MAPNFLSGPPLQPRGQIQDKYSEYKKTHDIKDPKLPKCDAKQCDVTKQVMKNLVSSNSDIVTNLAGNFGMSQDFWNNLSDNIQAYNSDPALNQRIADQKMEKDFRASREAAENAEKEYNERLKEYCANDAYKNTEFCKELAELEKSILERKIDRLKKQATDLSFSIMEWINTYAAEKLALIRMDELYTTRKQEFNTDLQDIDNVVTNIQVDSRKGFYEQNEQNFIGDSKIFIIFLYYILFLFYLFVSNFFPGQEYKKISHLIMIIIYLAIPFLIQLIVSIVYTFIYNTLVRFNIITDNIRENVLVEPSST